MISNQKSAHSRVFAGLLLGFALLMLTLAAFGMATRPVHADPDQFEEGDVFAGVGNGMIKRFSPDGTLLQTLDTTSASSEDTGMCFDEDGNLYATIFSTNEMAKFDIDGNLLTYPWGGPFFRPESCVFDADGNIYIGEVDGSPVIYKYDADGNQLDTYTVTVEARGTDWIDLAADQCTMYYTSEGTLVKQYDICTDTQLSDFATGLTGPCFALRIRPESGEVLVACSSAVYHLDSDGSVIKTCTPLLNAGGNNNDDLSAASGSNTGDLLFALNLDPDGETFWTAGIFGGDIYRINIDDCSVVTTFNGGILGASLAGLAIFGEITAGDPPPTDVNLSALDGGVNAFSAGYLAIIGLLVLVAIAGMVLIRRNRAA